MKTNPVSVLLIDDDSAFLQSLRILLEDEGYHVETACGGEKGLERLNSEPAIQVVVTDLSMPGIDGLQLLRRTHPQRPQTSFIVVSAHFSKAIKAEATRLGAFLCMDKPIDPDQFLAALDPRAKRFQ